MYFLNRFTRSNRFISFLFLNNLFIKNLFNSDFHCVKVFQTFIFS